MLIAVGPLVAESRNHTEIKSTDNFGFECDVFINSLTTFFEIFVCALRNQDCTVFDKIANISALLSNVYFSHQVTN